MFFFLIYLWPPSSNYYPVVHQETVLLISPSGFTMFLLCLTTSSRLLFLLTISSIGRPLWAGMRVVFVSFMSRLTLLLQDDQSCQIVSETLHVSFRCWLFMDAPPECCMTAQDILSYSQVMCISVEVLTTFSHIFVPAANVFNLIIYRASDESIQSSGCVIHPLFIYYYGTISPLQTSICSASVGYAVTWIMSQRILIHLRGTLSQPKRSSSPNANSNYIAVLSLCPFQTPQRNSSSNKLCHDKYIQRPMSRARCALNSSTARMAKTHWTPSII